MEPFNKLTSGHPKNWFYINISRFINRKKRFNFKKGSETLRKKAPPTTPRCHIPNMTVRCLFFVCCVLCIECLLMLDVWMLCLIKRSCLGRSKFRQFSRLNFHIVVKNRKKNTFCDTIFLFRLHNVPFALCAWTKTILAFMEKSGKLLVQVLLHG